MSLKQRVDAVIDAALVNRIVGCVVEVAERGKPLYARSAGFADREAGTPVREDTIFRLASVTKPVVAATALRMVDDGLLGLDDTVASHLPYFTPKAPDGSTPDITIRQLLTHTSGLSYGHIPDDVSRGSDPCEPMPLTENLRRLARGPLAFAPGTAWDYGMSIDVLGGVVAQINRSDLEGAAARYVTGPLGMTDTHFFASDVRRLAYPYMDGRPPVRMTDPQPVPDRNPMSPRRIMQRGAPQSGGSGMAGTARDFGKLLAALLGDFLKPQTRDMAFADQIGSLERPNEPGQGFGFIGAVVRDAAGSGWPVEGMIHWGGTWGNNWMLDPASGVAVCAYTNTMWEGCNGPFREEIRDAIFG